jgi:hypothetical protein
MDGLDILVLEMKQVTGWTDGLQVRALMFDASGQLHTLHEGKKHRTGSYSNADEEFLRLASSLLADGWKKIPEQENYRPFRSYRQYILYRKTTVPDSMILMNPALMAGLNRLIEDQVVDSGMASGLIEGFSITASLNKDKIDEGEKLLSMLTKLAELHSNGDLSDEEFTAAKKALLER